jgi:Glycosyltransferase like family 2/Glycosyl transferases group 1
VSLQNPALGYNEKILFIANANIPSLQLSFLHPLNLDPGKRSFRLVTEQQLNENLKNKAKEGAGATWLLEQLAAFVPNLIVFCRYSGPHPQAVVEWARVHDIPTIFHLDDDLLNVPIELGAAKHAMHNHPDRLATVRYLLDEATLVYCSTKPLLHRLFGEAPPERALAGTVYCAHPARAEPTTDSQQVVGYMGFDHAHDFTLALPALVRLLEARPDLPFEMFGSVPVPEELRRFGDRIRIIEPVRSYPDFVAKLASLRWTIGICPLAKTPFNEVKADTKWVEYTACGFATIASRGTVYDACCADGCGLLVDGETEWLHAFERLLDDPDAHRSQVERAQEKLRREYSPERLAEQILSVFARARELASGGTPTAPVAPEEEVTGPPPPSQLYIDAFIDDQVMGWAWSPHDRERAVALPLEIWCGEVRLGRVARQVHRPDVDAHVGDASNAKGFELPVGSLYALHRLLDTAPSLHPTVRLAGEIFSLPVYGAHLNDLAIFRTLRTAESGRSLHVADLWWANSRLLKIRALAVTSETIRRHATTLRVYQPLPGPDGTLTLVQVDEQALSGAAAIYPVGLRSPYMPILLVGYTQDGEIGFVDLLPFPSLLRGGLHETEVSALGDEAGSLSDLRRLSDAYLAECIGGANHPSDFALAGLDIDLAAIIGTEPIFDPSLRDWLATVPRIPLASTNAQTRIARDLGDRSFTDYAAAQLGRPGGDPARQGRLRLTLTNAAIPTIAGLVSRKTLAADAAFAPHIVTDLAASTKRWFVALPDGGPLAAATELGRLARSSFPTLHEGDSQDGPLPDPHADRLLPLAILFRDLSPPAQADLLFPVPREQPAILPEISTGPAPRVSVIVLVEEPERDLRPLLASLVAQVEPGAYEVIVGATAHEWRLGAIRASLNDLLPAHGQLVSDLDGTRMDVALNAMATLATGDVLIFLDQSVVLHDPRTLDTLARLAAANGAGTIGCMQVKPRTLSDSQYVLKSAGLFPGRCDFAGAPALALKGLHHPNLLPRTIYPVAANPLSCMAISAAVWRELGGLDARDNLPVHAGVDLAVRLVETGRSNLCTTLLSVYSEDAAPPRGGLNVFGAIRFGLWHLLPTVRASTLVKSF